MNLRKHQGRKERGNEIMESKKAGLNRAQLKYLALFFMLLDNAYLRFNLNSIIHLITRFVSPLFAWLLVDGFFHTRSREKYCKRLWIAALLMQAGNLLSFFLFHERGISDNIFLTLALSFSIIWLFALAEERKESALFLRIAAWLLFLLGMGLSFAGIPLGFGSTLNLEGGLQILPLVLIAYFFRESRVKQALFYLAYCFLLFFVIYGGPTEAFSQGLDMFFVNSDWMTWLVIPFFFLYNGEKGRSSAFDKWFFYLFYPAHLWILLLLQQWI
ncbi:protein TraX [Oribacterium sp. oral taxon 078 str. F0262]|nr:protein TraX [Oribacterium sp. oral taxon 078 str. F0262]